MCSFSDCNLEQGDGGKEEAGIMLRMKSRYGIHSGIVALVDIKENAKANGHR